MATIDTSEEVRGSAPSNPPRENLVRATPGITLERADGNTMPTLTGHFAVWDQWTEIRSAYEGNFMERFSPSSMAKTLSESTPKVLFQHGKDPQVADKPLGTVRNLTPDATGAFYEVDMLDTSYNRDLVPGLEAGLYGASFRFSVVREDVVQRPAKSEYNPRGIPERTVQEARVMEFGPVTFPAYAGATAGVRSMTDEYLFDALVEDPERLRELCRRSGISLANVDAPFTTSTGAGVTIYVNGAPARDVYPAPTPDEAREIEQIVDDLLAQDAEPDASERTTPTEPGTEPEPPEATTHSDRGLLWFAEPTSTRSK